MKSFSVLSILMLSLSMTACQRSATSEVAAPITGQERDAQGCIPTAGYLWSPARKACVKVFEAGIAFDPTPYNPDQTLHAFVLTAPANGNQVKAAELYWQEKLSLGRWMWCTRLKATFAPWCWPRNLAK